MKFKKIDIVFIIINVLVILFGCFYSYNVFKIENPQNDYAKFLVGQNNSFVKSMHNFLIDSEKVDSFTDDEKYSILKRMSEEILNQNDIVEFIVDNAPNNDNADFATVTETMRQTYLFLLQGEINILEQLYLEESERNSTNMTMGVALQNVMGEIVLQFPDLINNVRGTSYKADYIYVPDEDSFLVDGVLSDEEFNDYLEETPVEDIVEQTEEIIEQIQGE